MPASVSGQPLTPIDRIRSCCVDWPARMRRSAWPKCALGQLERALASFREGAATLETLVAAEPRNINLESRADAGVRTYCRRAR